jgi:hypothetical protein
MKILENLKAWLLRVLLKLKIWFPKNWMTVVNYLVIFIAYSIIYGKPGVVWAEVLLGLWIFVSLAYGLYKLFIKK